MQDTDDPNHADDSSKQGKEELDMLGGKGNLLRGLVSADALQVLGRDLPDFFSGHSTSSCFAAPALNVFSSKNSTFELQLVSKLLFPPIPMKAPPGPAAHCRSDPFTNFPSWAFNSLSHPTLLHLLSL